jgi:ammonia channel protein AmtB
LFLSSFASASEGGIVSGDTAWMIVATALVMLMTPAGLALFYGGLTRRKNVLNTIGMTLMAFAVGTLVWVVAGYSIAFGEGDPIGTGKIMLSGITDTSVNGTIPELLFVAFQWTFSAIAAAITSGSMIERVKFSTFAIFSALWILAVYAPVIHWAWGGGELLNFGEMDFAGGTVVHINAGLVGIWGSIATALFVAPYLRPDDYAIGTQLVSRMETVILTIAYSAIVTAIVFYISALLTGGGRVDDETEQMGLDEAVHGEEVINL